MNIFIDTEDMEERYGEQLYQDYLVEQNKDLQQRIDKADNQLITLIQIINEQPSKNIEEDNYLLSRLESIEKILKGDSNEHI